MRRVESRTSTVKPRIFSILFQILFFWGLIIHLKKHKNLFFTLHRNYFVPVTRNQSDNEVYGIKPLFILKITRSLQTHNVEKCRICWYYNRCNMWQTVSFNHVINVTKITWEIFTDFLSHGNYCLFYFWSTLKDNYNSVHYFTYLFARYNLSAKYKWLIIAY